MWFDAIYLKVRQNHRIISLAAVIAIGVTETGERRVLGVQTGASESEPFWSEFLRSLVGRGLKGVQLVISDAHEGLKAAISKVLSGATWQRCRVHTIRTQSAIRRTLATQRHVALQRDHMADLQGVLAHYNALDQQLQERLFLGEAEMIQTFPDVLAESRQAGQDFLGLVLLLLELGLLPLLVEQALLPDGQFLATLAELIQADHFALVGVDQPAFLAGQAVECRLELAALALFLVSAFLCQAGELLELGQQTRRVLQQLADVLPDGGLQRLCRDGALRASVLAR